MSSLTFNSTSGLVFPGAMSDQGPDATMSAQPHNSHAMHQSDADDGSGHGPRWTMSNSKQNVLTAQVERVVSLGDGPVDVARNEHSSYQHLLSMFQRLTIQEETSCDSVQRSRLAGADDIPSSADDGSRALSLPHAPLFEVTAQEPQAPLDETNAMPTLTADANTETRPVSRSYVSKTSSSTSELETPMTDSGNGGRKDSDHIEWDQLVVVPALPKLPMLKRPSVETIAHVTFSMTDDPLSTPTQVLDVSDLHTEGLWRCTLRVVFAWGIMPAKKDILIKIRISKDKTRLFGSKILPSRFEYDEYAVHFPLQPWPNYESVECCSFRRFSFGSAELFCKNQPPPESALHGWELKDLVALSWYSDKSWANDQFYPYTHETVFNLRWRKSSGFEKAAVRCLTSTLSGKGWVRLLVPKKNLAEEELEYLQYCSIACEANGKLMGNVLPDVVR